MEKIPTAREFIISTELVVKFDNTQSCILEEELPRLFIEFAKLHVEAALKAASEGQIKKDIYMMTEYGESMNWKESILNSYPQDKIK